MMEKDLKGPHKALNRFLEINLPKNLSQKKGSHKPPYSYVKIKINNISIQNSVRLYFYS